MTFKEKLKQDYPMLEVENATQNSCPCDYEYEEKPSSPECEISECEDCWNREIPTDKTEESLKILEAHTKAYEQGLNDAWELAKKIGVPLAEGGMHCNDVYKIFKVDTCWRVFANFTPQEALAKLKAYEDSKIEVNDEVKTLDGSHKGVVTLVRQVGDFYVLWDNGTADTYKSNEVKKTGKHIDIKSILEQIGE